MSSGDPISVEIRPDGVAQITLTRAEAANSRNQAMREALLDAYAELGRDDGVRCVVLTGAGSRHFCAGMDLKEAGASEPILARRERLVSSRDIEVLAHLPVPTIAMINGVALGGGLEMALACDLRYMAVETEVGLPELLHGLVPAGGATRRLPSLVGRAKAFELIYLGTRLTGSEAESAGLVNKAVPLTELAALVQSVATSIASLDWHALRAAKRLIGPETVPGHTSDLELDALLMLMAQRSDASDSE